MTGCVIDSHNGLGTNSYLGKPIWVNDWADHNPVEMAKPVQLEFLQAFHPTRWLASYRLIRHGQSIGKPRSHQWNLRNTSKTQTNSHVHRAKRSICIKKSVYRLRAWSIWTDRGFPHQEIEIHVCFVVVIEWPKRHQCDLRWVICTTTHHRFEALSSLWSLKKKPQSIYNQRSPCIYARNTTIVTFNRCVGRDSDTTLLRWNDVNWTVVGCLTLAGFTARYNHPSFTLHSFAYSRMCWGRDGPTAWRMLWLHFFRWLRYSW